MSDVVDHEARAAIGTHEKVCVERYGNIWSALTDIKSDAAADRVARAKADEVIHTRFNTISNRMWAAVAGVCAAAVLALLGGTAFLIAHLLQKTTH